MAASSPDFAGDAVAKFVPKVPEAQRELLFVDLGEARNVVPIVDSGEHGDEYVLVMPRAEKALRDHIEGGGLTEAEAVAALSDIAGALDDLDGRVVHRDLKPENVLLLNGRWCLADFGISRYAEATTAPDTRKYAMTALTPRQSSGSSSAPRPPLISTRSGSSGTRCSRVRAPLQVLRQSSTGSNTCSRLPLNSRTSPRRLRPLSPSVSTSDLRRVHQPAKLCSGCSEPKTRPADPISDGSGVTP